MLRQPVVLAALRSAHNDGQQQQMLAPVSVAYAPVAVDAVDFLILCGAVHQIPQLPVLDGGPLVCAAAANRAGSSYTQPMARFHAAIGPSGKAACGASQAPAPAQTNLHAGGGQ